MKTRLTGGSARQPAKKTGRPERRKVNTTSERRKEGDIYLLTRKSMSTNKGRTSVSSPWMARKQSQGKGPTPDLSSRRAAR
jgi:hypothetical protein